MEATGASDLLNLRRQINSGDSSEQREDKRFEASYCDTGPSDHYLARSGGAGRCDRQEPVYLMLSSGWLNA